MVRILQLLSVLLPVTLAAAAKIQGCGTAQIKADRKFVSTAFASDTNFCTWYLSSNRIRSPLVKVPTNRLLKACECKLQRKRVKSSAIDMNDAYYQPKCNVQNRLTLERKVRNPQNFCLFWQAGQRAGFWRSSTPFVNFGIKKVYNACQCYRKVPVPENPSSTMTSTTSTSTSSTTSSTTTTTTTTSATTTTTDVVILPTTVATTTTTPTITFSSTVGPVIPTTSPATTSPATTTSVPTSSGTTSAATTSSSPA